MFSFVPGHPVQFMEFFERTEGSKSAMKNFHCVTVSIVLELVQKVDP